MAEQNRRLRRVAAGKLQAPWTPRLGWRRGEGGLQQWDKPPRDNAEASESEEGKALGHAVRPMPARVRQLLLREAVSLEVLLVASPACWVLLIADEGDGRRGAVDKDALRRCSVANKQKKNCRGYVPRQVCSGREWRGTTHTHTHGPGTAACER